MVCASACLLALAASTPAVVMVDKPVTTVIAVPEKARRAGTVLLQLQGVFMRRSAPAAWNIFWEMPEADANTPVDNPHFAGYISSPANPAVRSEKPASFILELPPAALLALRRKASLRFTFVPVRKLPDGGVTITSLKLD